MAETTATKAKAGLAKFQVEFGDDHNRTIMVKTLKEPFRGSYSNAKAHHRDTGAPNIGDMNQMPDIPGILMTVDWRAKTVHVEDPLSDNPDLVQRINSVLRQNRLVNSNRKIGPVPAVTKEKLDIHTLKTLVIELASLRDSEKLTVTRGTLPSIEELEELEGRRLFDPMNSSQRKPRFVDQWEEWANGVDRRNI